MSAEPYLALYSDQRRCYTLTSMQKLRPPRRLRDRFAGMLLGAGASILMTYLALLAMEMILPLFNVKALSIVSTRRIGLGYFLMILIGGGWLAGLVSIFRYIYYVTRGTVYSRASRVYGAVFAAGIPVHAILAARVSTNNRWVAAVMLAGFAAVSVSAFIGAWRLDRLDAKRKRERGRQSG